MAKIVTRTQDTIMPETQRQLSYDCASECSSDLIGIKVDFPFVTPIFRCRVGFAAEINDQLARLILQDEQQSAGIRRSNVGGWHSEGDVFAKSWTPVARLKNAIVESIGRYCEILGHRQSELDILIEGWTNVSRYGNYNRLHAHGGWTISGVYYINSGVKDEARPDSGLLEFIDPRPAAETARHHWIFGPGPELILPTDGLLILFPSWLSHSVNPYTGQVPRISLAFNAAFRPPSNTI